MFVSCDQIIDFYNERSKNEVTKKYTSPYMGVYVGSFSGGMSGDLVLNVSKYPKTGFALYPTIGITPKYYYNFNRRLAKGKDIHNNSANYIAVDFSYTPNWFIISNEKNIEVSNFIRIIPSYGIRRNFAQNFNYEAKFGLGYGKNLDTRESSTVLQLGISIGYDF